MMDNEKKVAQEKAMEFASKYNAENEREAAVAGFVKGYTFAARQDKTKVIKDGRLYLKFENDGPFHNKIGDLLIIELAGYTAGYNARKTW